MAKGKSGGGRRRRRKQPSPVSNNFVLDAGPGCYIARRDVPNAWMLEWEDGVDPSEFSEQVPDIALDPENHTVTLCNVSDATRVAYVTIYETTVRGVSGKALSAGITVDNQGKQASCVTFIVLCPPRTFAHLCSLDLPEGKALMDVTIDSDVQDWSKHPNPQDEHSQQVGFPLAGGPYLCTQGEGGHLTHFFSGNLHAIDFRCPVGTEMLAVGDGVIVDVQDKHTLSGVGVSNLFSWNSILMELDSEEPLLVEYVHISSSAVAVGDRVIKGQVIGTTGSVGFSPEPHLHFGAYRSREPTAPTVRVRFESADQGVFLPVAGEWYSANGPVKR